MTNLEGSLLEASFIVANRLLELSKKAGRPVCTTGVHNIFPNDRGKASIWLDLNCNAGDQGVIDTLIIEVNVAEVAGFDCDEVYEILTAVGSTVRH